MKMTPTHVAELARAIEPGIALVPTLEEYMATSGNSKRHTEDQRNSDILWASKAKIGHLYGHYNDRHIATALRAIMKDR